MSSDEFPRDTKFGFLQHMESSGMPLVLVEGGYWTFECYAGEGSKRRPEWYTDIDVVNDGERQGLLMKTVPPSLCLDARALTSKGSRHAVSARQRWLNRSQKHRGQYNVSMRGAELYAGTYPHLPFRYPPQILAGEKGVWLGPDWYVRMPENRRK